MAFDSLVAACGSAKSLIEVLIQYWTRETMQHIAISSLLVVSGLAMAGCAIDKPQSTAAKQESLQESAVKSQSDANAKMADLQIEHQKSLNALQLEVVKQCVAKGNSPIFVNGNVDCKVAK